MKSSESSNIITLKLFDLTSISEKRLLMKRNFTGTTLFQKNVRWQEGDSFSVHSIPYM